jgi:hypothetical protein
LLTGGRDVTDYWLNKLFFDLQDRDTAARFKVDMESFLRDYKLKPAIREALIADDMTTLAPHSNAILLRFYYVIKGVSDAEFIRRLNLTPAQGVSSNG